MDSFESLALELLDNFKLDSKAISISKFGNGHINKTYEVKTEKGGHYILQVVNTYVFKDIEMLMNNIYYVTSYLLDHGAETLEIVRTKDDSLYYHYENKCLRVYIFSDNTVCFQDADPNIIKEISEAYGDLHKNLAGIDMSRIGESIPDFHNTLKRYQNFLSALDINFKNRKEKCQKEINDILFFKEYYSVIVDALDKKEISYTVTHNDPKINNVLFDKNTLKFRCVVDLDTVMPGTILYDFGDALRSLFTSSNEASRDVSKLKVDFEIYEIFLRGYASKMKDTFTEKEKELLPFSIFLISMELGIRFLDDYLRGDVYFGIKIDEEDNLYRARNQIALAKDVFDNMDKLNKLTKEIIDKV